MSKNNYPHTIYTYKGLQRILLCLILMCFITKNMNAQQFNNWYFPKNNGLTFNTNPISFLNGSQFNINLNSFSSSTISDKNGNFLFSSDGVFVWDRNNIPMPNGFGLKGGFCQINGTLIIPFIGDTSKYHLFNSNGLTFTSNNPDTLYYQYNVIDMNANNGLGDVIQKMYP